MASGILSEMPSWSALPVDSGLSGFLYVRCVDWERNHIVTLIEIVKKAEKLVADNSPAILTGVGVTGSLTMAFFAGRASFKAGELIADEQYRLDHHRTSHELDTKEKFLLVWKLYIPAVGTGVLTIASIIGANKIGTRRTAAVAAAYSISEKAISEYKDKVIENIGSAKEQKIRDDIAQDQVIRNPVSGNEVIITGDGEVLCYDQFSSRYFKSSMETLKKAQNDINYTVLNEGYASLGDFYKKIGIDETAYSEEVGWTTDKLLELKFSTSMSDDQRPCISFNFCSAPVRDYYRIH